MLVSLTKRLERRSRMRSDSSIAARPITQIEHDRPGPHPTDHRIEMARKLGVVTKNQLNPLVKPLRVKQPASSIQRHRINVESENTPLAANDPGQVQGVTPIADRAIHGEIARTQNPRDGLVSLLQQTRERVWQRTKSRKGMARELTADHVGPSVKSTGKRSIKS